MTKVYRNGNYSAYYGYVDPEDDPEEKEAEVAERFKLVWGWHKMDRTCTRCGEKRSVKYDVDNRPYCNLCVGRAWRTPEDAEDEIHALRCELAEALRPGNETPASEVRRLENEIDRLTKLFLRLEREDMERAEEDEEAVDHDEDHGPDWADTSSPVGGADLWWDPETGEPRCG